MQIYENLLYLEDIRYVSSLNLPWEKLKDSSILISGASGMIGSCLIDVLMYKNNYSDLNCKIYALGRNYKKAKERFQYCWDRDCFSFISHDINNPIEEHIKDHIDYFLHLASNTHPLAYANDPIGTITTNIIGLNNMLSFATKQKAKRFVFASSNEIYGENRGDTEFFDEFYCGYIDCNTMRAGYPESKRCGEALCQAYFAQYNLDVVIPRFTRSYGPTMLIDDSKAVSQFIRNGISGQNIVLKSAGNQYYSYTYVSDAVSGLLTILLKGEAGEAYNISNENGDITLKKLAETIADYVGTKVIFEVPDKVESSGYSTATKARLDGSKIQSIGWRPEFDVCSGIKRTINILNDVYQVNH